MNNNGKNNYMGNRNLDGSKNRRRNHKTNSRKEQLKRAKEKKEKQLKCDRQISRDKRKENRKNVYDLQKFQACNNSVSILFILAETPNNEKILMKKYELENGMYCVVLPSLTVEELELYDEETINNYLLETYNIKAQSIEFIPESKLLVVKDILKNESNLNEYVIRTYNMSTWFTGDAYTTVDHTPFYARSSTDTYLASEKSLGDIILPGFALYSVLEYRLYYGKLHKYDTFKDKDIYTRGTSHYCWTYTDPEEMSKLYHEEEEIKDLLFDGRNGRIHQNINLFLEFEPRFKTYQAKLRLSSLGYDNFYEWMIGTRNIDSEYNRAISRHFSRKRKNENKKKF